MKKKICPLPGCGKEIVYPRLVYCGDEHKDLMCRAYYEDGVLKFPQKGIELSHALCNKKEQKR